MYRALCYIIILSLFFSCSKEKAADITAQRPPETSRPSVSAVKGPYSLEITPVDASRNSTLLLIPQGFNLSDAKIEWLVNGNPAAISLPAQFKAAETKKGDTVQAKAIIQGREILSNVIQIKNAPPEINKIRFLPEAFKMGDVLYVDVTGNDIDGDNVTFIYEWIKNGEPAGNNKRIGVSIKRGDKISIKITPFDGEDYGRSVVLYREIGNMAPIISEDKKFNFDGSVYTYQVKAVDLDGDPLTYSLKTAPDGMTIDSSGLIRWEVPPDVKEKTELKVVVSDGHGGQTEGTFYIIIKPEE